MTNRLAQPPLAVMDRPARFGNRAVHRCGWRADPADLERPYAEVNVLTRGDLYLSLNPGPAAPSPPRCCGRPTPPETAPTLAPR
jgi:hypothetical protein